MANISRSLRISMMLCLMLFAVLLIQSPQTTSVSAAATQAPTMAATVQSNLQQITPDNVTQLAFSSAFIGPTTTINVIAVSSDGQMLAAAADKMVSVWNIASGASLYQLDAGGDAFQVVFSPDNKMLISLGNDKTAAMSRIRFWDAATGKQTNEIKDATNILRSLAISPDGKTLAAGAKSGKIQLWDGVKPAKPTTLDNQVNGNVAALIFSADSKMLAAGGSSLALWDVTKHKALPALKGDTNRAFGLALSPDGKTLVAVSLNDSMIRQWDTASGKMLDALSGADTDLYAVAYSPDGKMLVTGGLAHGAKGQTVFVWDATTGKQLATFSTGGFVTSLAFSADGKMLVIGGDTLHLPTGTGGNYVQVWSIPAGT